MRYKRLFSIVFLSILCSNLFAQEINEHNFNNRIQGKWIAKYYHSEPTEPNTVLCEDTLTIDSKGNVVTNRFCNTGQELVFKENWSYEEQRKRIRIKSFENYDPHYMDVVSLSKDMILIYFMGMSESAPDKINKVYIEYTRIH